MRVVSVSIAHDSSVCSINDGKIEFFCKEERLSRIKHDKAPFKSIQKFLSCKFGNVDRVIYHTPSNYEDSIDAFYANYLRKVFDVEPVNYSSLNHHTCHASIAFYNSGFSEALAIVIDRNGSILFGNGSAAARESESVFLCSYPDHITPIHKTFFTLGDNAHYRNDLEVFVKSCFPTATSQVNASFGIVKVYEAATTLIGQSALENGKTMGLSSYGEDLPYENLFINGTPDFNKLSHVKVDFNGDLDTACFHGDEGKITKVLSEENYQFYANKAKHVQLETQHQALNLIKTYVELTGITNVCVVGGYGLNVVANNYYIKNLPDVNFYFEPVADDTGVSIGAAMLNYRELSKDETIIEPENNFYHFYEDEPLDIGEPVSLDELVDRLISKQSIAIFEGSPEAGPRALGHRSILFDPRNPDSKDLINKVKKREWYRPFAGVVLEEDFSEYFETLGLKKSEYMTVNFDCKLEAKDKIPGVIHIDNTCRVQTVSSGFLYDLLKKFKEKTGCGVLLNTSFNSAGEPLIQTRGQAISMLETSELDCVYFVDDGKLVTNEKNSH